MLHELCNIKVTQKLLRKQDLIMKNINNLSRWSISGILSPFYLAITSYLANLTHFYIFTLISYFYLFCMMIYHTCFYTMLVLGLSGRFKPRNIIISTSVSSQILKITTVWTPLRQFRKQLLLSWCSLLYSYIQQFHPIFINIHCGRCR